MQNKAGFTVIELLIVLLLISMFGSFIIPTFLSKKNVVKQQFIADFATLIQDTLYQAITTKKIHQVFFDFDARTIVVKEHDPNIQDSSTHKQFAPSATINKITTPQRLEFRNFYIDHKDEIEQGKIIHDAWFYIMPDGTSQPVILNIEDQNPDSLQNEEFAITINPFYSQVQEHETFQKP